MAITWFGSDHLGTGDHLDCGDHLEVAITRQVKSLSVDLSMLSSS
jgi:hypothetical protein